MNNWQMVVGLYVRACLTAAPTAGCPVTPGRVLAFGGRSARPAVVAAHPPRRAVSGTQTSSQQ
jgi:hypothetical protein